MTPHIRTLDFVKSLFNIVQHFLLQILFQWVLQAQVQLSKTDLLRANHLKKGLAQNGQGIPSLRIQLSMAIMLGRGRSLKSRTKIKLLLMTCLFHGCKQKVRISWSDQARKRAGPTPHSNTELAGKDPAKVPPYPTSHPGSWSVQRRAQLPNQIRSALILIHFWGWPRMQWVMGV